MFGLTNDFDASVNMLLTPTTARRFYETPASGACKGRLPQVRHAYHMPSKTLENGRVVGVLPSGAAYVPGRTGGLVRINRPQNKHQRRKEPSRV